MGMPQAIRPVLFTLLFGSLAVSQLPDAVECSLAAGVPAVGCRMPCGGIPPLQRCPAVTSQALQAILTTAQTSRAIGFGDITARLLSSPILQIPRWAAAGLLAGRRAALGGPLESAPIQTRAPPPDIHLTAA